jgi:hypothetical protein
MTWKRSALVGFVLFALAAALSLWLPMSSDTRSQPAVAMAPQTSSSSSH